MQPLGTPPATPSDRTQVPPDNENLADRELLIDIDFFDAKGRWNPTGVVFCAAEDQARAKSLWTRCFRGFMALHGKLWAKNYLSSHFRGRAESTALLEQIKRSGIVDNKAFLDTVAQCTLRYEDLEQVAAGISGREARTFPPLPLKDIRTIVSKHFLQINWEEWAKTNQFEWLTLDFAKNIQQIFAKLTPNTKNDEFAEKLRSFMSQYEQWLGDPPKNLVGITSLIDVFSEAVDNKKYYERAEIVDIIFRAVDYYRRRSEDDKVAQEKIEEKQRRKKDLSSKSQVIDWSFGKDEVSKKIVISNRVNDSN